MDYNFKAIRLKDRDIVLKFLNLNKETELYPYYLNPSYLEFMSNGAYKYAIVDVDGDEVFVCIKDIKIFSTKYWRLLGYPISLSGNRENEDKVYADITGLENVRQGYINEHQLYRIGKTKEDFEDFIDIDFCSVIEDRVKYVSTSKYRSKNRLNIYKDKLTYRQANKDDIEAIRGIREGWVFDKKSNKKSVHSLRLVTNMFKQYDRLISEDSCDKLMVLCYENVVLGYTLINDMGSGHYHQLALNNLKLSSYTGDNEDIKKILSSISKIIYYYIIKDLDNKGAKVLSHAGSVKRDNLYEFKKILYGSNLKYYKVDYR